MRPLEREFERSQRMARMDYLVACMLSIRVSIRYETHERAEWINNSLLPFLFDETDKAIEEYDEFMKEEKGR